VSQGETRWEEHIDRLTEQTSVKDMLSYFEDHFDSILEEIVTICEIASPKRMAEIGLEDTTVDSYKNAIGRYPGRSSIARLAVLAHIDTVFPRSVDLTVEARGDRLVGPGIGDNSTSDAALLHLAAAWKQAQYVPPFDVLFVGNACEEGLGDLKGAKGLLDGYAQRDDVQLSALIAIDGKMGSVTNAGIGSRRLKVTIKAAGGHSWADFGSPSAIHAMGAAIGRIARLEVPDDPRTSYNVGVVEGGTSVNTIAERAMMLIDMRSVALEPLRELEGKVRNIIEERCAEFGAEHEIEVVGDRPVGHLPEDHALVQIARAAGKQFDLSMPTRAASTDANVPLSRGIPAITVGIYVGEGAHREEEWIEPSSLHEGLPLGLFILLGAVEWIAASSPTGQAG